MKCSIHNIYVINAFEFLCLYRNQLYRNWVNMKTCPGLLWTSKRKHLPVLHQSSPGSRGRAHRAKAQHATVPGGAAVTPEQHASFCLSLIWMKFWSQSQMRTTTTPSTGHRPAGHVCNTTPKTSPTKQIEQSSSYRSIDSNLCLFVLAETLTNHMIRLNNWIIDYSYNSVAYVRVKKI